MAGWDSGLCRCRVDQQQQGQVVGGAGGGGAERQQQRGRSDQGAQLAAAARPSTPHRSHPPQLHPTKSMINPTHQPPIKPAGTQHRQCAAQPTRAPARTGRGAFACPAKPMLPPPHCTVTCLQSPHSAGTHRQHRSPAHHHVQTRRVHASESHRHPPFKTPGRAPSRTTPPAIAMAAAPPPPPSPQHRQQQEDLVLSDVHLGHPQPGHHGVLCTQRFTFTLPPRHRGHHQPDGATPISSTSSTSSSSDDDCRDPDGPETQQKQQQNKQAASRLDADGDLLLAERPSRRRRRQLHHLTLRHAGATTIPRCGEQVWLGALLLADYLLAGPLSAAPHAPVVTTELGAGVGLVSLVVAAATPHPGATVFVTDASPGALALAARNATERGPGDARLRTADVRVRRLDWLQLFDTQLTALRSPDELLELLNSSSSSGGGSSTSQQQQQADPWAWRPGDLQQLAQTSLWLASDVVYDEALTDAFLRMAAQLMRWQQQHLPQADQQQLPQAAMQPRLVVALEKRYTFTMRDLDAVAPAYDHFLTYVQQDEPGHQAAGDVDSSSSSSSSSSRRHQRPGASGSQAPLFAGRRLDVAAIPQSLDYDRGPADCLELWELTLLPAGSDAGAPAACGS